MFLILRRLDSQEHKIWNKYKHEIRFALFKFAYLLKWY